MLHEIRDPAFAQAILPSARLECLHSGMRWAEGPVYFPDHRCLIWSDLPNNRLLRWDEPGNTVTVFREPADFANGHARDRQGRLISCEHGPRRVTRLEPDGSTTVLADRYLGRRLNSPNDVVVASDGAIWFTDPPYGILSDYEGFVADSEQDGNFVYRLDPATGAPEKMLDDMDKPNGLAFSPDESLLYVADSGLPNHIRAYPVRSGKLGPGRVLAEISPGVPDGLRVDTAGRIWTSAADGVHCLAPDGRTLGKILVPETVANLSFGGPRRNRLFITATSGLYALYVNATGCPQS